MENLTSIVIELDTGDYLMSWDVNSGYMHLRLHPELRKCFKVWYEDRY